MRTPRILVGIVTLGLVVGAGVAALGADPPPRVAFLARADNPVDALAASSVAAQLGGVVLLTSSGALSPEAEQALADFEPDLVVLAGGAGALADAIRSRLTDLGYETERVAGDTRLGTAQALATFLAGRSPAWLGVDGTAVEALHADDADRLDGYPASSLVRSAGAEAFSSIALSTSLVSPGVLLQTTIDAPTSGWLALDGGFNAAVGTSPAPLGCELHVDGTNVSGAGRIGATVEVLGGQYGGSCQTSGRVEVAAGSHVVTLHGSTTSSGSTASNRSLTAVFAPFDGAGAPAG